MMPRNAPGHANGPNRAQALPEKEIIRIRRARIALAEAELALSEKLEARERDRARTERMAALKKQFYGE